MLVQLVSWPGTLQCGSLAGVFAHLNPLEDTVNGQAEPGPTLDEIVTDGAAMKSVQLSQLAEALDLPTCTPRVKGIKATSASPSFSAAFARVVSS